MGSDSLDHEVPNGLTPLGRTNANAAPQADLEYILIWIVVKKLMCERLRGISLWLSSELSTAR